MSSQLKSYSELVKLKTFDERFNYLKLTGKVGIETFGYDRYLNQMFYNSSEWKQIRDFVIIRDNGCDLGIPGHDTSSRLIIHHMNPISADDLFVRRDYVLNPEYLITTTHITHNAIHYGDDEGILHNVSNEPIERKPNDMCPWKKEIQ